MQRARSERIAQPWHVTKTNSPQSFKWPRLEVPYAFLILMCIDYTPTLSPLQSANIKYFNPSRFFPSVAMGENLALIVEPESGGIVIALRVKCWTNVGTTTLKLLEHSKRRLLSAGGR
jgi:hypothetical protein